MTEKRREEYELNDFLSDDSFVNYHLKRDANDVSDWQKILEADKLLMARSRQAGELLDQLFLRLPENEFEFEYQKLTATLQEETSSVQPGILRNINTGYSAKARRIFLAVSTAAAVIVILSIFYFRNSAETLSFAVVKNDQENAMKLNLSDGTNISLGSHSELKYDKDFNVSDRKVYLKGNASFHVKKDSQRPFKVYVDHLTATVLGTVFNINSSSADSSYAIELLQGSLQVDMMNSKMTAPRTLFLKPNECALYRASNGDFFKQKRTETPIAVKYLGFKNADFQSVAKRIQEIYGVILVNNSSQKQWRFTAEFTNAEIKEVLQSICIIEGLTSEEKGDSIVLK